MSFVKLIVSAIAVSTIASLNLIGVAQTAPSNPLIGRWKSLPNSVPFSENPYEMVFSETGQMLFLSMNLDNSLSGFPFRYSVDSQPNPMHLDLHWSASSASGVGQSGDRRKATAQTIFEVTANNQLKLQVEGTEEGKPRPKAFKNEATFDRIAGEAIAKIDAQKLAAAEQSKAGEGQFVIGSLVRSAMIQNLQDNKFAATLVELGLNSDTANYRYQLQPQAQGLKVVARPKRSGFNSYVALLVRIEDKSGAIAVAKLCQSFQPSLLAPANPTFRADRTAPYLAILGGIQCASGSEAVTF